MDIRICWHDGRELVIENKPWANSPQDQLLDYIRDLEKPSVVDWHVVYLGGTSAEPDEKSLAAGKRDRLVEQKKLTLTTYGDLIVPWVRGCMGLCESDRFRWFLGEFKAYVLAQFRGERDMAETAAVIQTVLADPGNIEAAFEIQVAFAAIKKKLLTELKEQMNVRLGEKQWKVIWDSQFDEAKNCVGFNVHFFDQEQGFPVRFEFYGKGFKKLFFGVFRPAGTPDQPMIREVMETAGFKSPRTNHSDHWQWYGEYVKGGLEDWEASSVPWMKISDGSLVTYLLGLIKEVHDAFEKDGKLGLLK